MIAPATTSCDLGVSEFVSSAQKQAAQIVQVNPGLSMLVLFGVGVGIGALLGEVVPGVGHARKETAAERIGRQICESLHIKL